MSRISLSIIFIACAGIILGSTVVLAAEYSLEVENAIETPTETIEAEESTYEVSGLGVVDPGEPVRVDVDAPEEFTVELVNSDERLEDWKDGSGTETVEFQTDALLSGSYSLRLYDGGSLEAVFPLVVNGYDLTIHDLDEARANESFEFTVGATPTERDEQPDEVRVVIWDGDEAKDLVADHDSEDSYTVAVSDTDLESGVYDVYAVAVSEEETAHGTPEALAVSDVTQLDLTGSDDGSGSDSEDSDSGSDSEDSDSETDDGANESDSQDDHSDETVSDEQLNETEDTTPSENGTEASGDGTDGNSESDDEGVVSPIDPAENDSSAPSDEGSADEVPVTVVPVVLLSIVLIGLFVRLLQ